MAGHEARLTSLAVIEPEFALAWPMLYQKLSQHP
jgi:hypothetical protein